jgi:hypothetical protein
VDDTITTIYCLCDDFLKAIGHRDDLQVTMSTAEVMTVPLVAATFFGANINKSCLFLHEYGYVKKMLGKSRLNRRIHAIEPRLWQVLWWFGRWRTDGTFERLNAALRELLRSRLGRNPLPSAGIADSQSSKTTGVGGEQRG